jgi:hypothetical protein
MKIILLYKHAYYHTRRLYIIGKINILKVHNLFLIKILNAVLYL